MRQQQLLAVCHYCDWVARMPELLTHESALCPRCRSPLVAAGQGDRQLQRTIQSSAAWATAALLALTLALLFEFLRFETQGLTHGMALLDVPSALFAHGHAVLAATVTLLIVGLPALYLLGCAFLALCLVVQRELFGAGTMAHILRMTRPWLMGDVFIVGVLVSLIKIVTLADIGLGPSFFAFCAYALLMVQTLRVSVPDLFWAQFVHAQAAPVQLRAGQTAAEQGAAQCVACGTVFTQPQKRRCPGCGRAMARSRWQCLQWSWALLISAGLLLLPANVLPVMRTASLGHQSASTIIGGVAQLIQMGSWPIAIVIFVASIVVPIVKILILGWLCWVAQVGSTASLQSQMRLYRVTEFIGRWSMIDVFVVAVLTALIQAGWVMSVHPGPGVIAFAGVVILTMLAASCFDPRVLVTRQLHAKKKVVEQGV